MEETSFLIQELKLQPHPEGGFFSEIYRSHEMIERGSLPKRYTGNRSFSTSIYFMLLKEQVSLFHCILSDEIWHFYKGSPVIIHCLDKKGYKSVKLGNNLSNNEKFQFVIKAGTWFAAEVENKNSFSLVGCTVSPGFDFSDFELARRSKLLTSFPNLNDLIIRFTKE